MEPAFNTIEVPPKPRQELDSGAVVSTKIDHSKNILRKVISLKCSFTLSMILVSLISTLTIFIVTLTVQHQTIDEFSITLASQLRMPSVMFLESFMAAPVRISRSLARRLSHQSVTKGEYEDIVSALYSELIVNNVSYVSYTRNDDTYLGVCWKEEMIALDFYRGGCWCNRTISLAGFDGNTDGLYDPVEYCGFQYPNHMNDMVWWLDGLKEDDITWSKIYASLETREFWVSSYYPLHNQSNIVTNPLTGKVGPELNILISSDLNMADVSSHLTEMLQLSKNSFIYIVQCTDMVMVATSRQDDTIFVFNEKFPRFVEPRRLNESSVPLVREIGNLLIEKYGIHNAEIPPQWFIASGKQYRLEVATIKDSLGLGWTCLIFVAMEDFTGSMVSLMNIVLGVHLGIVALSTVTGILLSYMITIPLTHLGDKMNQIRQISITKTLQEVNSESNMSMKMFEENESHQDRDLEHYNSFNSFGKSVFYEVSTLQGHFSKMSNAVKGFLKFVPVEVASTFLEGECFELGVDSKAVSIFFSDIQGFTSITEQLDPKILIKMLSRYFEKTSAIIYRNNGVLDKYIGDAIMAFFNAPIPILDYEYKSCKTALEMREMLSTLNSQFAQLKLPELKTRIGISSGMCLVGNIGSSYRFSYTCLGDNVNLASRLESINKLYGTSIIISHSCYEKVKDRILCRLLDCVAVKGKKFGTRIYELIEFKEKSSPEQLQLVENYEKILVECYWKRNFREAVEGFERLLVHYPTDGPCKEMITRCNDFLTGVDCLPKDLWDGVFYCNTK